MVHSVSEYFTVSFCEPLITHLARVSVIKYNTDLIKVQTYKPKAQNLTNGGRRHASQTTHSKSNVS